MKIAKIIRFLRAYKRVVAFLLVFGYSAFLLIHPDEFGRFADLAFFAFGVTLIASHLFWTRRVLKLGERFIRGKPRHAWRAVVVGLGCVYLFLLIYSFGSLEHFMNATPPPERGRTAFWIEGTLSWWLIGSWAGFGLVMVFWTGDRLMRATLWVYRKVRAAAALAHAPKPGAIALDPPSPARRRFLEQTAIALSATPFVALAYGFVYERLDVEITRRRIRLARLPKAFEGFRIVQLSDFHISPFMSADQIRRCVTMANQLKADLVVMTGDFLAWDVESQGEVVQVLAGLRAPFGVFGCLGNHETFTETEESITRLFAAQGIHILRQERAPIRLGGETLNLIGVDDPLTELPELKVFKPLVLPDTVNILLIHEPDPNVLDRAVELGIDLTLAGHTHGGQLALEFLHRGLSLARLQTPYVSGWFEKDGAQLYVNRGIGTCGFPIRLGARPEITVLELTGT